MEEEREKLSEEGGEKKDIDESMIIEWEKGEKRIDIV